MIWKHVLGLSNLKKKRMKLETFDFKAYGGKFLTFIDLLNY